MIRWKVCNTPDDSAYPEDFRRLLRAIQEFDPQAANALRDLVGDTACAFEFVSALDECMFWHKTPQGREYWNNISIGLDSRGYNP